MSDDVNLLLEAREPDEAARWAAVQSRDARFDGAFFYGVRSTGIYCKPSCPSRRPGRAQVAFFTSPEAAEAGGFRACRRCRPREAGAADPRAELVERACRAIEAHAEGPVSLAALGAQLGVSPYHLQRTFKSATGVTPRQYQAARRVGRFKRRIETGGAVAEAIYEAGFGSSSRLYEQAGAELGMTPAVYARGGSGVRINYAVVGCALGRLLVAATARGLCAVRLGDNDEELESALAAEFSAAEIQRDAAALGEWVGAILRHLEGEQTSLDLPLDVRATAFQRRVWEELRRIPYGSTRSYGDVARALGHPTAVRAVARACASNPVALVTPCHRVVREDGSLGGYRWGLERKRALLEGEQTKAAAAGAE
ncbi:MAG TPA: bifunctional DNA-binding transcriptional regulator/O6-methylguanine-DNA methyltransferase Ada [Pyrinomonadaceae bacterium]|nr:bifunctional DNA-binding transcriptional regulator/O6-methylguanine-DNA methyltransferase Ada [Pyrinomonadaceae bacterium]